MHFAQYVKHKNKQISGFKSSASECFLTVNR